MWRSQRLGHIFHYATLSVRLQGRFVRHRAFVRDTQSRVARFASVLYDSNTREAVEVASYVLLNNGVVRDGRLAQLVRAPALQAGGRRFEPCTAHHPVRFTHRGDVVQLVRTLPPSPKSSKKALVVLVSAH
jgi:hypothetical protein